MPQDPEPATSNLQPGAATSALANSSNNTTVSAASAGELDAGFLPHLIDIGDEGTVATTSDHAATLFESPHEPFQYEHQGYERADNNSNSNHPFSQFLSPSPPPPVELVEGVHEDSEDLEATYTASCYRSPPFMEVALPAVGGGPESEGVIVDQSPLPVRPRILDGERHEGGRVSEDAVGLLVEDSGVVRGAGSGMGLGVGRSGGGGGGHVRSPLIARYVDTTIVFSLSSIFSFCSSVVIIICLALNGFADVPVCIDWTSKFAAPTTLCVLPVSGLSFFFLLQSTCVCRLHQPHPTHVRSLTSRL